MRQVSVFSVLYTKSKEINTKDESLVFQRFKPFFDVSVLVVSVLVFSFPAVNLYGPLRGTFFERNFLKHIRCRIKIIKIIKIIMLK